MSPTPQVAATSTYSLITRAPLTTIWTPPAACATPTPTLFGGACDSEGCSEYDPAQGTESWAAWVYVAYWTTSDQQVSMSCAPPSSQNVGGFVFSPAIGCPSGYQTASSTYYDVGEVSVVCCPSAYPNLYSSLDSEEYACWNSVVGPSETMVVAAYGNIDVLDSNGYSIDQYGTLSVISTTVFDAEPTGYYTLSVSAPAVAMVVQSSWTGSTSATATSDAVPASAPDHRFHLWHLSFVLTIVVLVFIGIGACMFACCFYCCLKRRCRRRGHYDRYLMRPAPGVHSSPLWAAPSTVSQPAALTPSVTQPAAQAPSVTQPAAQAPSVTQPAAQTPSVTQPTAKILPPLPQVKSRAFCAHKKPSSCILSSPSCCSCLSLPPGAFDRTKYYCSSCRTYWSKRASVVPTPPVPPPINRCSHGVSCPTFTGPAGSCCACNDKRRRFMPVDARLRYGYCLSCSRHWRNQPLSDLPPEWGMRKPIPEARKDDSVLYASGKSTLRPLRGPLPSDETHGQMHDLGPKYPVVPGPRPSLDAEKGLTSVVELRLEEGGEQDSNDSDEQRDTSQRKANISYPSESVSGSILDEGPTSRSPVFQVPATRSASRNDAHEEPGGAASNASSTRPESSTNTAMKQRRSKGLQRAQPRFSVNPDGTLNDG